MTPVAYLLTGLLVLFGCFHYLTDRRWTAERTRLVNELLSKSAAEFHLRQVAAGQDEPKRRTAAPSDKPPRPTPIGL